MNFKKIDKEFCLTDNSVNCYGYRLLTEGFLQDRFTPAIGYLMHDRDKGVAVKWTDFRREGDKLFAKPIVNTKQFADLAEQIEAGFYGAASVGHIVALELSDDLSLKLEGQTGPTVVKWFPRECSIVDIPGNFNALANLYDTNNKVLRDLSAAQSTISIDDTTINRPVLTAAQLGLLNLKANADVAQVTAILTNLVAQAAKVPALSKELANLKAMHEAAQKEANTKAIEVIVAQGIKERKLSKALADRLSTDYANNPDGLKTLVDGLTPQQLVTQNLGAGYPASLPEHYKGKTYGELYVMGGLADLKANFPDYYEHLKTKQ